MKNKTTVDILTTLYKSEPFVRDFAKRTFSHFHTLDLDSRIIFVDDGSPDNSAHVVATLIEEGQNIKLIRLSRNFGHHEALLCGLDYCEADYVYLLDSDLEEIPEHFQKMYTYMLANKAEAVYGVIPKRDGSWLNIILGNLFYKFFNYLCETKISSNILNQRIMSKKYYENLRKLDERNVFLAGLWQFVGFKQLSIPLSVNTRSGTSYSFAKRVRLVINAISSFSIKPLYISFWIGFLLTGVCVVAGLLLAFKKLIYGSPVGWTSLAVLQVLIGGVILLLNGILSIYVGKIMTEVKGRPRAIVNEIINGPQN